MWNWSTFFRVLGRGWDLGYDSHRTKSPTGFREKDT